MHMRQARSLEELYTQIMARKGVFLSVFFIVMLVSYGFLVMIDFVPEPVSTEQTEESEGEEMRNSEDAEQNEEPREEVAPFPATIHIDALDRVVKVMNPTSRAIEDLDAALLEGVVRHPDSADFNDPGNIFILGHSSYLPTVFNKNFQAFNGIQDLSWGDTIRLRSADTEYIYRVERVYEAKASDVVVPNSRGEAKLTLATCDTFGAKEDRFIVEATLIDTKTLES